MSARLRVALSSWPQWLWGERDKWLNRQKVPWWHRGGGDERKRKDASIEKLKIPSEKLLCRLQGIQRLNRTALKPVGVPNWTAPFGTIGTIPSYGLPPPRFHLHQYAYLASCKFRGKFLSGTGGNLHVMYDSSLILAPSWREPRRRGDKHEAQDPHFEHV